MMNEQVTEDREDQRDYEAEAKAQGWAPEEQWRGKPEDFKTAEEFVKAGESIPAILKSKVDKLESRVEQLLDSNKKLNEMSQRTLQKERKEKENLIAELEEARKQAITEGDGDAFDRADKQINDLKREDIPPEQKLDPMAKNWLDNNPWYESNGTLAAYADGLADRLVAQGYTGKAYFDELTKRVHDTFPDEFGNKNRDKPSLVESGTPSSPSSKRTFDNLPSDAKEAFAQFAKDIPGLTKEQFVEQYDWD
jgi:hypothetical protein